MIISIGSLILFEREQRKIQEKKTLTKNEGKTQVEIKKTKRKRKILSMNLLYIILQKNISQKSEGGVFHLQYVLLTFIETSVRNIIHLVLSNKGKGC